MKIKTIACTQFAGILDRNIALEDGINLIYGKNESGKSTLVNLLSRTLFQNARIDGRSDKEFKELYFPGARKGGKATGDFADGKIVIETENGTYTLTKEWGSDARCTLSTPDGAIRDQKKIDAILKDVLLYGEGVYSDMLFSSQRNTDASLQTILDASKKTNAKQEITDAVSQAFSESDGITADAIEQAINKKIAEIAGKHWNTEKCMPVRRAVRWENGRGEILEAYYALEDAENVAKEFAILETEADAAVKNYGAKDLEIQEAEAEKTRFIKFENQLEKKQEYESRIKCLEKEKMVAEEWPVLTDKLNKAIRLKQERDNRKLLDKYASAKELSEKIEHQKREIEGCACPEDSEISAVGTALRNIQKLENKLCGMNLNAAIKLFGDSNVSITSLRTGEELSLTEDLVAITEAVKIEVPGVIEIELSPADVNMADIEAALSEQARIVNDVFARYKVDSLDKLEELKSRFSEINTEISNLSYKYDIALGGTDYAELESAVNAITGDVRDGKKSIEDDIIELCGSENIVDYIAGNNSVIGIYEAEYGSADALNVGDIEKQLAEVRDALADIKEIPVEYIDISDFGAYLDKLEAELNRLREERNDLLEKKGKAGGTLEAYLKEHSDYAEKVEETERIFNEKKALLGHWLHIAEVFGRLKEDFKNNPMQDISNSFTRYLGVISGGRISSDFPDTEKLNMNIYSSDRLMDYAKLSEGTKETVSLAFRLAVLDHLFPDGGGVIVFDDPFTDMDADRTAQSCELIKECAKRHQVIFLTCKEEYVGMLGGNEIRV